MNRILVRTQVMGLLISSYNVPNLLSLSQVDPQLPPGCEFLPVTEVVSHFLAGIPRHQRWAVLHVFVSPLHVGKTRWCPLETTRGTWHLAPSPTDTDTHTSSPQVAAPTSAFHIRRHVKAALFYGTTSRHTVRGLITTLVAVYGRVAPTAFA